MISEKLGLGLAPFSIENYIKESVLPGMSRTEALDNLRRLGDIQVIQLGAGLSHITTDQIDIGLCSHPLNNITVFLNYSDDAELLSVKIDADQ